MASDDLYQRADDRDLRSLLGDPAEGEFESFDQEPRTSGLAVASLVSSLIFCCPLVSVMGPILGVAYFVAAAGKPWLRGKGLAIAGIVLGTLVTAATALGLWAMVQLFVRAMELPGEAIARIEQRDDAGVRELFFPGTIPAGSGEIEAFAAELEGRYGAFVSAIVDQNAAPPEETAGQTFAVPMLLTFEGGTVSAVCEFSPAASGFDLQLRSIEIRDPARGDLRFPSDGMASGRPSLPKPSPEVTSEGSPDGRIDAGEAAR